MAIIRPPSPPSPPPPTENVYTPSQFENVKAQFKHYLFKIIPNQLKPFFLILHDKEDNPYPSVDTRGRVSVRDDLIESELYDLRRKCTNDGSNAGSHSILIEPAVDSIVIIDFVSQVHRDSVNRIIYAHVRTAGGVDLHRCYYIDIATGTIQSYPNKIATATYFNAVPIVLTDAFEFIFSALAISVSEDSDFFLSYSFIGDAPTITETGPTGSVFSDVS